MHTHTLQNIYSQQQQKQKEYWCMVNFVRPNFLGSEKEFHNNFGSYILDGQRLDSSKEEIKMMKYRLHVLNLKLST